MLSNLFLLQTTRVIHLWDVLAGNVSRLSRTALENLQMEAYIGGIVIALIVLAIASLIAISIPYEPGKNPKDPRKRRMWMIILGALMLVILFALSLFATQSLTGRQASQLQTTLFISTVISTVIYFALAFVLSKAFRKTKLGTWFPAKS